jgi:hypothetical protein
MTCLRGWVVRGILATAALWTTAGAVTAQDDSAQKRSAARFPFEKIPAQFRNGVRDVVQAPTLYGHGPAEAFVGDAGTYAWLLDHPDRGMRAWRRLGAKCSDVKDLGNGRFGWTDEQGSEIHWQVVFDSPTSRIWFAEGSVRPGPLMPAVHVQAVLQMRHGTRVDNLNRTLVCHQAEIFFKTDNKTAILITRLIGDSAPRLAEQFLGQIETFFSGITWYLAQHPERSDRLFADAAKTPHMEQLDR